MRRMARYAALLRGINLGSNTTIKMEDLRQLFMRLGYSDITSYLQSGNVVFASPAGQPQQLANDIEGRIASDLSLAVPVLIRTGDDLQEIVTANPFLDRQSDPTKLHVTFLAKVPPDPGKLDRPNGETAVFEIAGREVYLHCPDGYGRTKLSNAFIERRLGVAATTRNWRTVCRLRDLVIG
jgi:uncharacterized protein (DUF1697 family)